MKRISYSTSILFIFIVLVAALYQKNWKEPYYSIRQASAASFRYVAPSGSDSGDCSSPDTACRTLQFAVNKSASGDTILVAEGTYTFDGSVFYECPTWTSAVICYTNKDLTILGGYSTSNWFSADPDEHLTVIDGQNAHRGVMLVGFNTSRTYYLTMEGFTIQNARALGPNTMSIGAGMLIQHAAVNLQDMVFKDNLAIGQSVSSGDGGSADGAGLRLESTPNGSVNLLRNVVFDNNQSIGGNGVDRGGVAFGALFVYNAAVVVEDGVFTNNLAQGGNGSGSGTSKINGLQADALGAGIAVEDGAVDLRRVTITGNIAQGGNAAQLGGGAYGAGVFVEGVGSTNVSSLTLSDAYVANNSAIGGDANTGGPAVGGGVVGTNSAVMLDRVSSVANLALGGDSTTQGTPGLGAGGGIYLSALRWGIPKATMKNIVVADNKAAQGSGNGTIGNGGGGGVIVHGMDVDISHATIARNHLEYPLILAHGLLVQPWPLANGSIPANVLLSNSIVANHAGGDDRTTAITCQVGSSLTFVDGMFAGNSDDINADGTPIPVGSIYGLESVVSSRSAGFLSPGAPYYNYNIRTDSSAVDQAETSTVEVDVDGFSRPYGYAADLGGHEYRPFTLSVSPGDESLRLDWTNGSSQLAGSVSYYEVTISCEDGANPPVGASCEERIYTETSTTLTLSGLSNYKEYDLMVYAYDGNQAMIATSNDVTASPTDLQIFIPMINR